MRYPPRAPTHLRAGGVLLDQPRAEHNVRAPRRRFLAYDICDQKRRNHVRQALEMWRLDAQYSVIEVKLGAADRDALLADLITMVEPAEDKLALWQPLDGVRITLEHTRGETSAETDAALQKPWPMSGNWIIAYDVRDPQRLHAVQHLVAAHTQALQRSVYWLRSTTQEARRLAGELKQRLDLAADRCWLSPLHGAGDLWFVVGNPAPVLPVGGTQWQTRPADGVGEGTS